MPEYAAIRYTRQEWGSCCLIMQVFPRSDGTCYGMYPCLNMLCFRIKRT